MTGSLAFRKSEQAIFAGNPPAKYTRLLPFIPPGRILEFGSAEGVLALLLAQRGDKVVAIERSRERWESALLLAQAWQSSGVVFVCGDITERLELLDGMDVFVGIRSIYYLGDRLDDVFAEVATKIPIVVLAGNCNRARWWFEGVPNKIGGPDNFYASGAGMRALLERHGYKIVAEELSGDPIVVGALD